MKIEYDREADALYIGFQVNGKVKESIQVRDGVVLDIAFDGRLFGIEILDVSHRIPESSMNSLVANLPLRKAS